MSSAEVLGRWDLTSEQRAWISDRRCQCPTCMEEVSRRDPWRWNRLDIPRRYLMVFGIGYADVVIATKRRMWEDLPC